MPPYRDDDQKSIKEETFTLKSRYIDEAKNWIRVAQYTGPDPIMVQSVAMNKEDLYYISENADDIIYAEWTNKGAMGCSGTERIFIFRDGNIVEYVTKKDEYYYEVHDMMSKNLVFSKFLTMNAGFGNYAWKNRNIRLTCSDKDNGFVTEINGKPYLIKCSVRGVYNSLRYYFSN